MNNKERSQVLKMLYLITQIGFTMGGYDLYKHGHRISDKAYIWEGFYGMVYRDRCAGGFSLRVYSYTEIPE